jgi:hypothetical protein
MNCHTIKLSRMKYFITLIIILFFNSSFSQVDFKVFFGTGFDQKECTLILSYHKGGKLINDTLLNKEILHDNEVTGLSHYLEIKIPKKGVKHFVLIIDDVKYNYRFDKVRNKSQLKIEYWDGIDFCLYQKNKFIFY